MPIPWWGPCSALLSSTSSHFVSLKLLFSLRLHHSVFLSGPQLLSPHCPPPSGREIQALPRQCLKQSMVPIILRVKANTSWPIRPSCTPNSPPSNLSSSCSSKSQAVPAAPVPHPTEHQTFARRSGPKRRSLHHLSRALATGRRLIPGFMAISTLRSHGHFVDPDHRSVTLCLRAFPTHPPIPKEGLARPVLHSVPDT